MKHYCLYQAEELMFLGEAEDADRATDEDIPGTDVSAAAYQTNRSLFDKSTKIGTHID